MSDKEIIREVLENVPENVSLHEFAQRIELIAGVRAAAAQFERGEGIPLEDIKREMSSWIIE